MRHLITAGLTIAGLASYYFGLSSGSGICFIAAAVFEIVLAKRLSHRPLP
ncbi:MAG: hypothetical protein K2P77_11060 [Burkholderiaceae bacterium]|nr:hypothetical protein [Burkholderiaceae bacterium]